MTPARNALATIRLAALIAGSVIGLSLAGMALQYRLVSERLLQGQHSLLAAELDGFGALYDQRRIIALREAIDYRTASATGREMLLLQDRGGERLAGTRPDWPEALSPLGEGFTLSEARVFTEDGQRWLGVGRLLPGGFPLLVARSLAPMDETLASLRRGMAGIAVAMIVAGGLAGWWAAHRVMGRLARVNRLADRVAGGDLLARLPGPRSADEFGQLETHVHAMLDRIAALNRATHRLSDHIAHELRTPLNRIAQRIEAVDGPDGLTPDLRAEIHAEIRATIRVFDALLDISRAEADQGDGAGLVPVDISDLCAELAELYAPLAEDRGLTLTQAIPPGLMVLGDRTLIGQMVANLLDNAVKYCRPGDTVDLALSDKAGRILLVLRDTGPGLPSDLRGGGFEPFRRGARDRDAPGHGLGLALVQAIAARHGAKLRLPDVEKGFVMEIDWPRLAG